MRSFQTLLWDYASYKYKLYVQCLLFTLIRLPYRLRAQYSYTNTGARRREIAVVELYEGGSPWNGTEYSSVTRLMSAGGVGLGPTVPLTDPTPAALTQPLQPRILVLRQTYLLPQATHISRVRVTLSEHGVTTKSLISELYSWHISDPY